jgi:hypothetical protein
MTSLEEEFLEELLQNEYGRLLLGEETAAKLRAKLPLRERTALQEFFLDKRREDGGDDCFKPVLYSSALCPYKEAMNLQGGNHKRNKVFYRAEFQSTTPDFPCIQCNNNDNKGECVPSL